MKLEEIRAALAGKTIHILPYNHADVAWVHSRFWHLNRYALILDELLERMEAGEDVRFFVDSWVEFPAPYLAARPDARERMAAAIADGRLAVCCGHYGNVRPTQVGDETFLRNLVYGKRGAKAAFPAADLAVYASLDVAIGHSQLPQILRLGGCPYYLCWRPSGALDVEGLPRRFRWRAPSGHEVIVARQCYAGLWDAELFNRIQEDWPAVVRRVWEQELAPQSTIQPDPATLLAFSGMDDTRIFRDGSDRPLDVPTLIREWNRRESSRMQLSTPPEVFAALSNHADRLPLVEGCIDPAEVHYNVTFGGARGLWRLREMADRALITAETFSSVAWLVGRRDYPSEKLRHAWRGLLDACPHAVQALFREDWEPRRQALEQVISDARSVQDDALAALLNTQLPIDANAVSIVNPLPVPRRELVTLHVPEADWTRPVLHLTDAQGRPVPMQPAGEAERPHEAQVVVEVEVPACGYARLVPSRHPGEPDTAREPRKVEHGNVRIRSGDAEAVFESSRLLTFGDLRTADENGLLAPLSFDAVHEGWLLRSVNDVPRETTFDSLTITEDGPLRRQVVRTGRTGPHVFRQRLTMPANQPQIETTTELWTAPDAALVGLSLPTPAGTRIADIPFGVEPRQLDKVVYGKSSDHWAENLERMIDGMFWARRWVSQPGVWIGVAVDGDRYWRLADGRLVHWLTRLMPPIQSGWEAWTVLDKLGGYERFQHVLRLIDSSWETGDLVRFSRSLEHPLQTIFHAGGTDQRQWLRLSPDCVQLSAFYVEDGRGILRVFNASNDTQTVQVELPCEVAEAELVDLLGMPVSGDVRVERGHVAFSAGPWAIRTVRLR